MAGEIQAQSRSDVVGAGAAGGGIGALIALVADSLPESSSYKTFLTISAPILAVGLGGLWLFVKGVYIDPFARRKKSEAEKRELDDLFARAEAAVKRTLDDPNASQAHKDEVLSHLQQLEALKLQRIQVRMEYIVSSDS